MKIRWLPVAVRAQRALIDYIASDSASAALAQSIALENQVSLLASYPELGRLGRVPGTRELVVAETPYIVVYRIRPRIRCIEIMRVLHGAQKWPPCG